MAEITDKIFSVLTHLNLTKDWCIGVIESYDLIKGFLNS